MSILSATILLFLVIDPLGNIPCFLCALKETEPSRHRKVIGREMVAGLCVLTVFLFAGSRLLSLLNVSQASLGMAGGIILFIIAIRMIFSGAEKVFDNPHGGEPFIVPLAVPLTAGPSSMSTVMLLMAREPERWLEWLAALVCAWAASVVILLSSSPLSRIFGARGLTAIERLMGMILTTVAVQMFVEGIQRLLDGSL